MGNSSGQAERLVGFIEEQRSGIACYLIDLFLDEYPASATAALSREDMVSWTDEELDVLCRALRGENVDPNVDMLYFGDIDTQASGIIAPLVNYIEGSLFIGEGLAAYYCNQNHGSPRYAQMGMRLIEDATLRIVRSAMQRYADRFLQSGALLVTWAEDLTHPVAQSEAGANTEDLSKRELEVLRLVSAGKSNSEVGEALGIRPNTVKNHLARMYDKANVNNRTELARWGINRGLV